MMGYCEYHEENITPNTFEWKGCWTCQYFQRNDDFMYVEEVANKCGVSKKTIYRWIKKGKLNAILFQMGRLNLNVPKKRWVIWIPKKGELK